MKEHNKPQQHPANPNKWQQPQKQPGQQPCQPCQPMKHPEKKHGGQ